ncbi:cyclin-dependent kinase 11B isoform X3 [Cynoglossus semilaevis]|uniref:cyclin-dependent kinase n=1 Tax=Cynoglossus semilaevis TaxID=244447 RepID=A0A3P8UZ33_CYNSE|nr:cyclin-dependent kinase 11B-like isoform X3 [Cynoglossus semilaevis]
MGDEKDTWKVKTLDEILLEKKRRREQEERTDTKPPKNHSESLVPQADDRDSKRDTPEEGELRDPRMEITIRNSPYTRQDSTEDRGEEDESLAIKPPQLIARKDKSHNRKEEKRKDKRRHRSHSDDGGKRSRPKEKEKERESDRRKRQWEEDKARREWERQKRREDARAHSRRERERLEQAERQRERDRKLREQQKEHRDLKERERRNEERRKERVSRRDEPSHHRMLPDEYGEKTKQSHRSRSPVRVPRERSEHTEQRKTAPFLEEKPDTKDLLADLQDISDSERKTSSAESSLASGSGSEEEDEGEEEEESSSQSEGGEGEEDDEEEDDSVSGSARSEQSAEDISEDEQSEEEFDEERENGNHIPAVPESRFDHDTEESGEEMEDEEDEDGDAGEVDVTPQSQTHSNTPTPEENYIPDSPPISPVELKKELPKYLPGLQGCRSVEEFQCLNRIEEGTYGVVYRAKDKKTDEIVALKRLKMEKEKEGFPITSLREINTILKAQHPNIVTVREIVVGSNMDKIYIVMNYVEHDLKSLMETMKQPFLPGEVKTLMIQLLRGVRHLHDNWILHRDLKTSNLLLSHKGILKVGDFGLAREYGSPLKPYTPVVVTLWYRSPELLLGAKEYSTAVDMWSVGCIFGELLTQKPLFPGKSELDQIQKIFKDLGTPSEKIWPGYNELPAVKKMNFNEFPYNNLRKRFGALLSDQGFDLMNKFLTYCPSQRILSDEGLKHEYFRETPLPIDTSMFPTWPAKSEQQRVKRGTSPRPPEGGLAYSHLGDDDLKDTGFHLTTSNQGASAVGPGFSLKF